jgi:Flp pilus assembly protein TadD
MLMLQGGLDEAVQQLNWALQLKPDFAEARTDLGAALAAQGKLNDARFHFQQALNLAQAQNNIALEEIIRARLKAVQSALPPPEKH